MQAIGQPDRKATGETELVGAVMDMTELKRAEEALRRAQSELARVARMTAVGALGASIAHEINQPLAAIKASAIACLHWLENGENLSRARESLDRVIVATNRADEIVKRIQDLTRNKSPEMVRLDMNAIIEEVIDLTRAEVSARQVSVTTDLPSDTPAVSGDRVQLQQVLWNLITNAIEAMTTVADRRRELTVTSGVTGDGAVEVTVRDNGPGLDPAQATRIFDAFYTTKPGGMGIGLSISSSIVKAHGGRMWVSRVDPHGAAFHFAMPTVVGDGP